MHRDKNVEMMGKTRPLALAEYLLKPSEKEVCYAIK